MAAVTTSIDDIQTAYFHGHQTELEEVMTTLINGIMENTPDDPLEFMKLAITEQQDQRRQTQQQQQQQPTTPSELASPPQQSSDAPVTDWTAAAWLESIGVSTAVAGVLLGNDVREGNEFTVMRRLCEASEAAIAERLRNLADTLAAVLRPKLQELNAMSAPSGAALHAKFAQDVAQGNGFELRYSDLSTFYGGLEAKIGTPSPNFRAAMVREHTRSADSIDEFRTSNYGVSTTPEREWRTRWHFVVEPDGLLDDDEEVPLRRRWAVETKIDDDAKRRMPMRRMALRLKVAEKNVQLEKQHEPPLSALPSGLWALAFP